MSVRVVSNPLTLFGGPHKNTRDIHGCVCKPTVYPVPTTIIVQTSNILNISCNEKSHLNFYPESCFVPESL